MAGTLSAVSRNTVALVTSNDPELHDPEVAPMAAALTDRGVPTEVVAWDDQLDWSAYALVAIRSTWDYFDRVAEFCEWAAAVERVTRLVNPADVVRWNSHKGYLVEFAAKGVPTVPTQLVPAESVDVVQQIAECPWTEIVVKPAVDGGARLAVRGDREDEEVLAHAVKLASRGDVVVQPFVPGVIVDGERSLIFFDGRFSHAVRKVPASGDYRSQIHLGGSEHDHEPDSAELRTALAAIEAAPGHLSYLRVDLVDWESAPSVIEFEAIEPNLFIGSNPDRMDRFVRTIQDELTRQPDRAV